MSRQRFQRGTLREATPGPPVRKLPRGEYWARWQRYVQLPDGTEKRRDRTKVIDKELAAKYGIGEGYPGPLTEADARRVLDLLIAQDSGVYVPPDTAATFEQVTREYVALNEPQWGANTKRVSKKLIDHHLVRKLGTRRVAELKDTELQAFVNEYVNAKASRSLLAKIVLYLRAVLELAVDKKIIDRNPARRLRAKSRKRPCNRSHTLEECQSLLANLHGRDHLIVRMFIQLGLRPEEMFALRRDDVIGDQLRIDEAFLESDGEVQEPKTESSNSFVYTPPDLALELRHWVESTTSSPRDWLFPASRGGAPIRANNYIRRVLKPAAAAAQVEGVNFQSLRRTCATLFGRHGQPKDAQAQLRHADPYITLKHYQQIIPATVKAAAHAFEAELLARPEPVTSRGEIVQ